MSVGLLKDMVERRPLNVAMLGLDVGKKTIGLALSDPGQTLATPLQTIRRTRFAKDMEFLNVVITEYDVDGFVLGYPVNMDGSEGPCAQSIRDFAIEMERTLGNDPWIALWDERLSTVSADNIVDKMVQKRKTKVNAKASGLIDKLAAQVILQGALDFMKKY
ncbi:MAG TPA: Holliday junction resolvase RuvX [Alphaproteobacteria bacterium]|nr:Holliday junction resolvase RuvX [Alphaproteobacteria bacterium]